MMRAHSRKTAPLASATRALATIARGRAPARYVAALHRFRFGNTVADVDHALDNPVP